jgi:hypothetical protein
MRRLWLGAIALVSIAFGGLAFAQAQGSLSGAWSGDYTCTQGLTGMTLYLRPGAGQTVGATAVFFAHPDNPNVPSGCYEMRGAFDRANGRLTLDPVRWVLRPADTWEMTSIEGQVSVRTGEAEGRIFVRDRPTGCTTFKIKRNARPFKPAPRECVAPAAVS